MIRIIWPCHEQEKTASVHVQLVTLISIIFHPHQVLNIHKQACQYTLKNAKSKFSKQPNKTDYQCCPSPFFLYDSYINSVPWEVHECLVERMEQTARFNHTKIWFPNTRYKKADYEPTKQFHHSLPHQIMKKPSQHEFKISCICQEYMEVSKLF